MVIQSHLQRSDSMVIQSHLLSEGGGRKFAYGDNSTIVTINPGLPYKCRRAACCKNRQFKIMVY